MLSLVTKIDAVEGIQLLRQMRRRAHPPKRLDGAISVALEADEIEHRQTALVRDDGFAIEQERTSGQ